MNDNRTFTLANSISVTEIDNEIVLLNFESGHYFGLNHVGASFIELSQKGLSFGDIVEHIAEQYKTSSNTVHNDLKVLVEQLVEQGLICLDSTQAKRTADV